MPVGEEIELPEAYALDLKKFQHNMAKMVISTDCLTECLIELAVQRKEFLATKKGRKIWAKFFEYQRRY